MKYTVELNAYEERRLLEAKGRGISPEAFLKAVLAALPEPSHHTEKPRNPTAELFAEWEWDAGRLTDEERTKEDALDDEFLASLAKWEAAHQSVETAK